MIEQKLGANEEELKVIKEYFADNERLLKNIRNLMLGIGELTAEEKTEIKTTFNDDRVYNIFMKKFLPHLDSNSPLGQEQDIWGGVEQMVFGASENTIQQAIAFKRRAVELTGQALNLLKDPEAGAMNLNYNPEDDDELGCELLGRNQYVSHVKSQLIFMLAIAGKKDETAEETLKRIEKDSLK